MEPLLGSNKVHDQIDDLLLTGKAQTALEAEAMFLNTHLPEGLAIKGGILTNLV